MAGHAITILAKEIINDSAREGIKNIIISYGGNIGGDEFEIDNNSFLYVIGEEYEGQLEAYAGLEDLIGWKPKDMLVLVAAGFSKKEDIWLGNLCIRMFEILDGVVAFGGLLPDQVFGGGEQIILYRKPYRTAEDELAVHEEAIMTCGVFLKWFEYKYYRKWY